MVQWLHFGWIPFGLRLMKLYQSPAGTVPSGADAEVEFTVTVNTLINHTEWLTFFNSVSVEMDITESNVPNLVNRQEDAHTKCHLMWMNNYETSFDISFTSFEISLPLVSVQVRTKGGAMQGNMKGGGTVTLLTHEQKQKSVYVMTGREAGGDLISKLMKSVDLMCVCVCVCARLTQSEKQSQAPSVSCCLLSPLCRSASLVQGISSLLLLFTALISSPWFLIHLAIDPAPEKPSIYTSA